MKKDDMVIGNMYKLTKPSGYSTTYKVGDIVEFLAPHDIYGGGSGRFRGQGDQDDQILLYSDVVEVATKQSAYDTKAIEVTTIVRIFGREVTPEEVNEIYKELSDLKLNKYADMY